MARLLAPRSIAVVGASATAGSLGARTIANLARYEGAVYPINAKYTALGELPCYPALAALPQVPDCVVLAVGKDAVEPAASECAALGVGGLVLFASGYAETGTPEGITAQARLAEIGRRSGMRIVGPNCTGVANILTGAHAAFAEFPPRAAPRHGTIGLVTQSGALGLGLSQAAEHGTSFSHVLTCGNSCDVDVADYVAYLASEPACGAIALAYEGVADPARLAEAARRAAAAGKKVVVCKLARSADGIVAARHHTGSDAGTDAAFRALCGETGMVAVERIETLVETATFFAKVPARPRAPGVAVASSSGGSAIIAADTAARHGVALPQPGMETLAALRAALPSFAAMRNPCDATAQATGNPALMRATAEALLADPRYGALVVPLGKAYRTPIIPFLGEAAARHGKAACMVWMSQWSEGPGAAEAESESQLALFRSIDSCFAALAAWLGRGAA